MFATEKHLLAATNLCGLDAVAQRAAKLRHRLKAMMPFVDATGDLSAISLCCQMAAAAGAILLYTHRQRNYTFLSGERGSFGTQDKPLDPFVDLPAVDPTAKFTVEQLEQQMQVLESHAGEIARLMPHVLIRCQRPPFILYGAPAARFFATMPPAANAA